jgi:hypothetical protein
MHVGVEEAVAEHLGEEDLYARRGQRSNIYSFFQENIFSRNRHAAHPLHHDHALRAELPVHLGHGEQRRAGEVAPQLARVRRLAHQIELLVQVAGELRHHFARLQPLALGAALDQAGGGLKQRQVLGDRLFDARPQHLDRDLAAVLEGGEMYLRDRGARVGLALEGREHLADADTEAALDLAGGKLGGERRHAVLQLGELVGDVERQQVAPRREDLPELDEDWPEHLERLAQPHRARRAPPRVHAEIMQPEAQADGEDANKASEATQGARSVFPSAPARRAIRRRRSHGRPARRAAPGCALPRRGNRQPRQ